MCGKCIKIDKTIERFRQIKRSLGDQLTLEHTQEVIADLEAKKSALHPERQHERVPA
jgi:hypothetical protein